jgi:sugar phosphate isomerase/epimerase
MSDVKTRLQQELGAQSYCFRHFKENATVIEKLKACGVNRIELCGVHADFSDESGFDAIIKEYSDAGVVITSIGVQGFKGDETAERKFFEFARRAGARVISASFDINTVPNCFEVAQKLADEFDINLAIHNHGGYDWLGNATTLRKVFSMTGERIGLCLDTAWALQAGCDPLQFAEEFGSRLYGIHIKDFVFDRAGKGEDVVVGTGNLDLPKLFGILESQKYSGYAVLEYEGDVENPVPAITECVAAVRAL